MSWVVEKGQRTAANLPTLNQEPQRHKRLKGRKTEFEFCLAGDPAHSEAVSGSLVTANGSRDAPGHSPASAGAKTRLRWSARVRAPKQTGGLFGVRYLPNTEHRTPEYPSSARSCPTNLKSRELSSADASARRPTSKREATAEVLTAGQRQTQRLGDDSPRRCTGRPFPASSTDGKRQRLEPRGAHARAGASAKGSVAAGHPRARANLSPT
jgi:hypothetical protein